MVTLDKIYHAAHVLKSVVRHTDLIKAPAINMEADVWLKPENLQVTGSFKVRGSGRKPRSGCCPCRYKIRNQIGNLPSRRRPYLQG